MFEDKDDTILARWLAGTLTQDEKTEFEKTTEYKDYVQIIEGLDSFKKPSFNKEALRTKINSQIKNQINHKKKGKVINLKPFYYAISVAASVVLIVGIFFNEVNYKTLSGEQLKIDLPDGSKVQLNAESQLTHTRFFWKSNKTVSLQGEGFFEVQQSDGFTVKTNSGTITVLGTQFNIKARKDKFELTCYKGKVQFEETTTQEKTILTKGNVIKKVNNTIEKQTVEEDLPSWTAGRSSFDNVPLSEVLSELKIQFGIDIENTSVDMSKRFTGSFFHNDLEIALKTVLVPMQIDYQLINNNKTLKILSL